MAWIHDLSPWLFGPLCVGAFVGVAVAGVFVAHRLVHQRLGLGATLVDNGVVGWFFSGTMVLYAITLGLITVATWEGASQVSGLASKEAAGIAALYRDLGGYPQPLRDDLRGRLRQYTRFIVEKEWPAQRGGEILDDGTKMLNEFQVILFVFEPTTEGQKVLHAEALGAFNRMIELRRQRTAAVNSGAPAVLWAVVLLGGLLAITFSYCFHLKDIRLHALLTAGLSAMIGLLVFLIASLDQPYRGAASVSAAAYELIIEGVMTGGDSL